MASKRKAEAVNVKWIDAGPNEWSFFLDMADDVGIRVINTDSQSDAIRKRDEFVRRLLRQAQPRKTKR